MDKKITEMTVLQKAITSNSSDIQQMDNRLRFLEVEMARHNAQEAASTSNAGRKGAVR